MTSNSYCLILPHYNHANEFTQFLPAVVSLDLPIIVVDDGSDPEQFSRVADLLTTIPQAELLRHTINRGKGTAVKTAICHAGVRGFTHCFQIDADGQHNHKDVHRFIAASERKPDTIICGKPVFDDSAPKARLYGRKVTDFWVAIETLSLKIKDGLCGFRIYPVNQFHHVQDRMYLGPRMDFDTEVLVKAVWLGVPLQFIDTRVQYPVGAASHFHYLRDNLVLIRLHTRLMFGMIKSLPLRMARFTRFIGLR